MLKKFILGDCMNPEYGLPSYPDKYFDLIITDPPYGIDFQSARRTEKHKRHKKIQNDKAPFVSWIKEAFRVLKPGGRIVLFYRWDVAHAFHNELKAAGFNLVAELIWDKCNHGMGDLLAGVAPMHENAIYATKGRFEFPTKRPKSVYRTMRINGDMLVHPNEKPVSLWRQLLNDFAIPGNLVLDPFCGSASSLIACEQLGFDYVGFEIDPDYYEAAQKRMQKGIQSVITF